MNKLANQYNYAEVFTLAPLPTSEIPAEIRPIESTIIREIADPPDAGFSEMLSRPPVI